MVGMLKHCLLADSVVVQGYSYSELTTKLYKISESSLQMFNTSLRVGTESLFYDPWVWHYNHHVSPSVRPLAVSEDAHNF